MKWAFWVAFGLLIVIRLPSLVQPAGADQGLYAYVGQEIARGGIPYRDAWDQKPPAVHYTYALMLALWPHQSVVAATDLLVAGFVAYFLVWLGRRLTGGARGGELAALLYLLLGNPVFTRLGGARIRAQSETFVALLVTAALLVLATRRDPRKVGGRWSLAAFAAGVLLGLTFLYKYNTVVYLGVGMLAVLYWPADDDVRPLPDLRTRRWELLALVTGFLVPLLAMPAGFAWAGALADLYHATITYNLQYSGETYAGPWAFVQYLIAFPAQHARVDSLWLLGGLGCLALIGAAWRTPARLIAPAWVVAACLSIAINGSRGLPQYFVQAQPALALAAGLGGVALWARMQPAVRWIIAALLVVAVVRISTFPKLADYTLFDLSYLTGRISFQEHRERFGDRESAKYSAIAVHELGEFLRSHTRPDEHVFVFGFSPGAYVEARRRSASRFFWSRPVILEFNADDPRYGSGGLLAELEARKPAYVVLQLHDWSPDVADSADYFMSQPILSAWLRGAYEPVVGPANYAVWQRRPAAEASTTRHGG